MTQSDIQNHQEIWQPTPRVKDKSMKRIDNPVKTVRMKIISFDNKEVEYACEINSTDPSNKRNELIKSVYRINEKNELFNTTDDQNEFKLTFVAFTYAN